MRRAALCAAAAMLVPGGQARAAPEAPGTVIVLPGGQKPASARLDGHPGPAFYAPALPPGTPQEQVNRDPAQPVANLAEALERAYWTNPQLLAERSRTRSLDYRIPQARGQYGPQLEYSASRGFQRDNVEQPTGGFVSARGWTTTASAVLRQPIFTFGRLRAAEESAVGSAAFGQSALRESEQQVLLDTITAYANVIRDRAAIGIATDNVGLLSRQSQDTDTRLAARESTRTDSLQVSARLELARSQLLAAQAAAGTSEASFLRHVGAPAGDLALPAPLPVPAATLEDAYAYAIQHNPVIAAAQARERVSRGQRDAARADLFPRIDLTGQASYSTAAPYFGSTRQTELRGAVTLSGVIDSGVRRARINEAAEANDADWRLIDSAVRENREELAAAWNEWQSQLAAIDRLAVAVTASREAFEGGLLQQRAGLRTTLDMLELARDLLEARSNLNSASAAAYAAQGRVLAAMGSLDHRTLLNGTPSYDAQVHLRKAYWQADIPLLTSLSRALDSTFTGKPRTPPLRDPAAPLATPAAQTEPR